MENTFTTSRGITVTCLPIGTLLDKVNAQFALAPLPPTYQVETGGGAVETHAHFHRWVEEEEKDEDGTRRTVKVEQTSLETAEDRLAWAEYLQRLREHTAAHHRAVARLTLLHGIDFEMPADDAWVRKQELIGLHVPEDPLERRLHYAETEIVANTDDMMQIQLRVFAQSGIDEEVVRQIEATFRRAVGRTRGNAAGRSEPAADERGLEPVTTVRVGGDGSEGAAVAEPV